MSWFRRKRTFSDAMEFLDSDMISDREREAIILKAAGDRMQVILNLPDLYVSGQWMRDRFSSGKPLVSNVQLLTRKVRIGRSRGSDVDESG